MCDFAQHVIIDPTGIIWLGRNWNLPPASAAGHNGDRKIGPFAVVVLGDFGVGGDRFLGEQRITTIHTIGLIQKRFDLDLETLRLHREMSTTECPGSTLHRLHILEAVREFRNSSTFVRSTSHAAAGDGPFRAECDILCQVLEDFSNHMPLEIEPADAEIIHQENVGSTGVSSSDHGPNASSSSLVPLISETVSLLGKCDHEAEAGHSSSQVLGYPRATEGLSFTLGQGVLSASHTLPYERHSEDPLYRLLRIFVLDPSVSLMDGSVEVVAVPYEPLSPGPAGRLFVVDDYDESQQRKYIEVDLDEPRNLMRNGREPSVTDPLFHQQMVYAVCSTVYPAFRVALGRHVGRGLQRSGDYVTRLQIRPHAFERKTSYYDETRGELSFGYYRRMTDVAGRTLPSGWIFSCLSFEIVAHDVTHALLHGLRSCVIIPSSPDVPAFHEAFADIVALFSHFSLSGAVDAAIRRSHGRFSVASVMENVAREFSYFSWTAESLRTTLTPDSTNRALFSDTPRYGLVSNKKSDPHELGSILVSAVFEAFLTVLSRKVKLYVELATGGSGELLIERLPSGLISLLAKKASKLASQFLSMCIRGIDYCPPVDIQFGDFLRAVITADSDLVPDDDEWHYREAWIDAFRRRGIYPHDVSTLSEDALLWNAYRGNIRIVPEGAPAQPPFIEDPVRQARALGEIVADERYREEFGLAVGSDRLDDDKIDVPCVESVRTSRRVGPIGQLCYFVIAEITQRRAARGSNGVIMPYYGGATVILGPQGDILYVIAKSVLSESRLAIQRDYAASNAGRRFWQVVDGVYRPRPLIFSILHEDEPENGAVAKEAKTGERPTDEARNVGAKIPPEVTHRGLQTMSGRTKVFVSYSHKDHIWLKHLTTAIAPLASKYDIDAWSDNRIRAGQNWREEIKVAIESARVAILLVSQSFLASDFIQKHEVTPLLEAAEQSGLKLLSIAITSSLYEVTALEKYQWLNDPERPLDSMKAPVRNRQLVDIAKQIGQAVLSTAGIASGAPS